MMLMHSRSTGLLVKEAWSPARKPASEHRVISDSYGCLSKRARPPAPVGRAPADQARPRRAGLRAEGSMPPRGRRPDRVKKLHKASKEERKGRRSHAGFLVAAVAVLGGLAASIWCVATRRAFEHARRAPLRRAPHALRPAPPACARRGFVAAERKTKQRSQARWLATLSVRVPRPDLRTLQELRQRLLSKPLVFSEHAACRMDCRRALARRAHSTARCAGSRLTRGRFAAPQARHARSGARHAGVGSPGRAQGACAPGKLRPARQLTLRLNAHLASLHAEHAKRSPVPALRASGMHELGRRLLRLHAARHVVRR